MSATYRCQNCKKIMAQVGLRWHCPTCDRAPGYLRLWSKAALELVGNRPIQ